VEVVDPIGAGDVFGAAALAHLFESGRLGPDLELGADELRKLLDFACTAASVACTRVGAEPPWRSELGAYRRLRRDLALGRVFLSCRLRVRTPRARLNVPVGVLQLDVSRLLGRIRGDQGLQGQQFVDHVRTSIFLFISTNRLGPGFLPG